MISSNKEDVQHTLEGMKGLRIGDKHLRDIIEQAQQRIADEVPDPMPLGSSEPPAPPDVARSEADIRHDILTMRMSSVNGRSLRLLADAMSSVLDEILKPQPEKKQ